MSAIRSIRSLDYTVIRARDMDAMRHFYAEVMHFPLERELGPGWVEYRAGSNILALSGGHPLTECDAPVAEGASSVQLAFRVPPSEVDACARELAEKNVEILSPPTDQSWGHRTLFFRDPDGNLLEIYADI